MMRFIARNHSAQGRSFARSLRTCAEVPAWFSLELSGENLLTGIARIDRDVMNSRIRQTPKFTTSNISLPGAPALLTGPHYITAHLINRELIKIAASW